jgi:hypothetical protein
MKIVGVLIADDAPQFVALCSDAAVWVVGEGTGSATRQGDLCQTVCSIPLVVGDCTGFSLTCDLSTERIVAVLALAAVRQELLQ